MAKPVASRGTDQFMVRMPDGMRDHIASAAARDGRSMNSEIVARLERYDTLGNEVDLVYELTRALAVSIVNFAPSDEKPDLIERIVTSFMAVDELTDRQRVAADLAAEVERRFETAVYVPPPLAERVSAHASKEKRSFQAEVLQLLDREYPAPADVMHIHLDDIREALDRYERETDPRARMRLQGLVEALVTSGEALTIDWE